MKKSIKRSDNISGIGFINESYFMHFFETKLALFSKMYENISKIMNELTEVIHENTPFITLRK